MEKQRSKLDYRGFAFIPLLVFLFLYVGCGVFFTLSGVEDPFGQLPRYVAIVFAICVSLVFYDRKVSLSDKLEIYTKGAGRHGVMLLSFVVLLAGGFQSSASAIGAESAIVNMGIDLIPLNFLVPGIFLIACIISTATGTSMGTQVAIIPVAIALANGAGINSAMAGAAAIAGAYFGDSIAFISSTLIVASNGVGEKIRNIAKLNFLISLPAIIITTVLYALTSAGDLNTTSTSHGAYTFVTILPYIVVIGLSLTGMNVVLVLALGIASTGIIGIFSGTIGFFEWTQAMSSGMESMFFLAVFSSLVSGLIELIEYYRGIDWLLKFLMTKIKGARSCEYLISIVTAMISGATLNNTVAVIITAPIAKELGDKYSISRKKVASLMTIFSSGVLSLVPYDSSVLLAQKYGDLDYLNLVKYSYYPFILLITGLLIIQFGLFTSDQKE
ncbi:Na+/H+ antiporter NhaC family protein [Enterococcus casseliflavus]|uniref:Na+/H+ antiporter NhaC family protein n=1 Tax=Enterococcus casseliflavus TaxID=37734 RepID=UPI00188411B5|nr:Na+/H+ antiporter NhaC family protein [Enterococcus casseliflavus]MBE9908871.1 Na+/H+ antiporter NhaC family protein [Enterococcus casseliflavus]